MNCYSRRVKIWTFSVPYKHVKKSIQVPTEFRKRNLAKIRCSMSIFFFFPFTISHHNTHTASTDCLNNKHALICVNRQQIWLKRTSYQYPQNDEWIIERFCLVFEYPRTIFADKSWISNHQSKEIFDLSYC